MIKIKPDSEENASAIDVAAWRQELAPLYSETFLANRSDTEIIELVRALGRVGVDLVSTGGVGRQVRRRTAEERKKKFLEEAAHSGDGGQPRSEAT